MATTTTGLGKLDLAALRQADRVCFFHNRAEGGLIRAIKVVRDGGPFAERERAYEVRCESRVRGTGLTAETTACFQMFMSAQSHEEWRTIVSLLKFGDEVGLHWHADDHRSGYVERSEVTGEGAGQGMQLHADALFLKVKRGDKRMSFLLDVSVCPDNTARMVRG